MTAIVLFVYFLIIAMRATSMRVAFVNNKAHPRDSQRWFMYVLIRKMLTNNTDTTLRENLADLGSMVSLTSAEAPAGVPYFCF